MPTSLAAVEGFTPMPIRYEAAANEAKFLLLDISEQFRRLRAWKPRFLGAGGDRPAQQTDADR